MSLSNEIQFLRQGLREVLRRNNDKDTREAMHHAIAILSEMQLSAENLESYAVKMEVEPSLSPEKPKNNVVRFNKFKTRKFKQGA